MFDNKNILIDQLQLAVALIFGKKASVFAMFSDSDVLNSVGAA